MKSAVLAAAALAGLAAAQSPATSNESSIAPEEYVWGAVILNMFADRIPLLSANYSVITPTGQNQMFEAGDFFRGLYISTSSNTSYRGNMTIQGISPDAIDLAQVNITTMAEVWVQQSAQAFMEGLYPPLNDTVTEQTGGPLNSVQNPLFYVASDMDPTYLYLNGSANCPKFDASVANLMETQQFTASASATQSFYDSIRNELDPAKGALPDVADWYGSAYEIWDWLQHMALNDSSVVPMAQQARYAADAYMQAVYANTTADHSIRAIGGYTLAAQVLNSLYATVDTNGTYWPLNIYFTGPEPVMSLAALMELTSAGGTPWQGMPDPGSSLVFELFSSTGATPLSATGTPTFPGWNDLQVRVFLRNGTNSTANFDQQAMFGQQIASDGPAPLSMNSFSYNLSAIADADPGSWCGACSASSVFCAYYTRGEFGLPDGYAGSDTPHQVVSPVVAGVIGALVALAVAGLTILAAMLLFGLRFRRKNKDTTPAAKTPSSPRSPRSPGFSSFGLGSPRSGRFGGGGFKGGEKLASDVDLPRGGQDGTTFGAVVTPPGPGHLRTSSYEMNNGGRKSLEVGGDDAARVREGV